jgi:hypothetical protein
MPENKGTVLFVSYMFPPVGGAATIRIVKFIHHLRQQGWHIIVLTADKPAKSFYDETLFEELPDDILIYRTHELNPTARYFHPEASPTNEHNTFQSIKPTQSFIN